MSRSRTAQVHPILQPLGQVPYTDANNPEYKDLKAFTMPPTGPHVFPTVPYPSRQSSIEWDRIKLPSDPPQTSGVMLDRTEPSDKISRRRKTTATKLYGCLEGTERLLGFLGPLAVLATAIAVPAMAANMGFTPHLRIGCGFTSVSTAVSLIPLRRDERAGNEVLIPIYALSLTCSVVFILLHYRNIVWQRDRVDLGIGYLFGTFLLSSHFLIGLIQTSDTALEGIVDFGPVVVPIVAAVFSLLFQRRRMRLPVNPLPEEQVPVPLEEIDIAVEGLRYIGGSLAAV
ncbi:hypothetical protein F5Y17DRAFT_458077 [Xylariaceae sp. FL0594]|nr:hypothetical protein F5Y17DRAFT_458077 [Xylariaceae sp. FL0594]